MRWYDLNLERYFPMPAPFQRIEKTQIGNRLLRSVVEDERFSRVFYEEVSFFKRRFRRCTWTDCRFRRCAFLSGTRFEDCAFAQCKFDRAHTYMGGPSFFVNCRFEGCLFENVQFWESEFERSSFPKSKFVNVVFYGPEAPKGWQTELREVDFTSAEFEFVDFRCGIDLSSTRFPSGFTPQNVAACPNSK